MQPTTTNWQRAYKVRSTLDKQLSNLSEALATKDNDNILSAFIRLENSIQELKQLYVLEVPTTHSDALGSLSALRSISAKENGEERYNYLQQA